MAYIAYVCSADLEITVEFLAEVDKLVQMIESPIFACKNSLNRLFSFDYCFVATC